MAVIKNGVFYPDGKPDTAKSSSQFKAYDHQRQREDHKADIVQRFVHGKPNPEFIRLYKEEAQAQFTPQEILKYGNQYGE